MSGMDDTWTFVGGVLLVGWLLLAGLSARSEARAARARTAAQLASLEAKVDAIAAQLGVVWPEPQYPEVERLLAAGKEIAAIKAYREATGADLLTAKIAVDALAGRRS